MAALALAGLVGCAQVGPVQPPSARLPRPPRDFAATRSGPDVLLRWTPPSSTSDGVRWSGPTSYNLCAWPGTELGSRPAAASPPPAHVTVAVPPQIPSPPAPDIGGAETPTGATMPACPHLLALGAVGSGTAVPLRKLGVSGDFATLALYPINARGEGAGWSNPVALPLTPVAPPPQLVTASTTVDGVQLTWTLPTGLPVGVAVYRNGTLLGTVGATDTDYLDTSAAFGQHYTYWLRSTAGEGRTAVESADSSHLEVDTKNVFPPPVPTGLQAVAAPTGAGVDLSWNAITARDLAGYNLYRLLPSASTWEKLNRSPLPTPVYHDTLPAGVASASYAVSSQDLLGNESARTPPVAVQVP